MVERTDGLRATRLLALVVLLMLACRSSDASQTDDERAPSTGAETSATDEIHGDPASGSVEDDPSHDTSSHDTASANADLADASSCPDGVCTDGRPGAICAWGAHRGPSPRPEPAPCRAGLRCCPAGGAAGSDSTCRDVGDGPCPPFP